MLGRSITTRSCTSPLIRYFKNANLASTMVFLDETVIYSRLVSHSHYRCLGLDFDLTQLMRPTSISWDFSQLFESSRDRWTTCQSHVISYAVVLFQSEIICRHDPWSGSTVWAPGLGPRYFEYIIQWKNVLLNNLNMVWTLKIRASMQGFIDGLPY